MASPSAWTSGVCAVRAQVSALGSLTHACPGRHSAAQQVSVHLLHRGQSNACVHHKQVTRREESSCSLNPSTSRRTVGEVASTFRRGTLVALLSPFPPNSTDAGSMLKISPGLPGWVKGRCLHAPSSYKTLSSCWTLLTSLIFILSCMQKRRKLL